MTTHSQVYQVLRDFLASPDDAALRRKAIRYLAHRALAELRAMKRMEVEGVGDQLLCPRCWGTGDDEVGTEDVPCRRCKLPDGTVPGTVPKP